MDGRLWRFARAPPVLTSVPVHAPAVAEPLPTTPPRSQPVATAASGPTLSLLDQTIADREARLQRAAEQREQFKRRVEQMAAAEQHVKEITTPAPGRQSYLTTSAATTINKAKQALPPQQSALTPPEDDRSPLVVGLTRFAYTPRRSRRETDDEDDGGVPTMALNTPNPPPKQAHQSSILQFVSPSKKPAATATSTTTTLSRGQSGDLLQGDISAKAAEHAQKPAVAKRRISLDDDDDDGTNELLTPATTQPASKHARKASSAAPAQKLSSHLSSSSSKASLTPFVEIETMGSAACGSVVAELYEAK